ncbi:protein inscuteable homolog [Erythrolamprus reginae]|uniref:protein inscuteable homolog n=1 Tax=Erythrolamprus reginae TaxID=121349 RepID=UPI00396C2F08
MDPAEIIKEIDEVYRISNSYIRRHNLPREIHIKFVRRTLRDDILHWARSGQPQFKGLSLTWKSTRYKLENLDQARDFYKNSGISQMEQITKELTALQAEAMGALSQEQEQDQGITFYSANVILKRNQSPVKSRTDRGQGKSSEALDCEDACKKPEIIMAFLALAVQRMHLIQMDSVQRWMEDLKLMTDSECMCILQSKPISLEEDAQGEFPISSQHGACDNLQLLLKRAWIISTELTRIVQKLEKNRWQRVHSMTVRVNCHVRSMINEYNTFTRNSWEEMHQYEKKLVEKCSELTTVTERCIQIEDEQILKSMKSCINDALTTVAQYFAQLIELALTQEIKNLVKEIDSSDNLCSVESAVSNLFSLTQEGSHLCRIIAKEGGIVALLKICHQDCFRCLFPQILRTLASVCCVEEGIQQLEKVDGILCLADILTDDIHSQATHAEAAAVIAQITSPQLTFTQHLNSFLENMEEIVTALLKLCQEAASGEVFLLASAALANITFLDSKACEMLLQLDAMKILIAACSDKQKVDSPYSRDQVVTVLANLSVLDQCASEIIQQNGIQVLMEMLSEKSPFGNSPERAACEQVQQKAAVTLARLSRDPEVANSAIKLNCIPHLIQLCRSPVERNNSDSVLVACLAALRRLAVMSPDGLQESDFQQLVKPRLVDSFLLCTNMEESFV